MATETRAAYSRSLDVNSPGVVRGRLAHWDFLPQSVEYPKRAEDVARLVAAATHDSKTVLPTGEAEALSYLGRPPRCDLALSLSGLTGLVELNPGDLTVTVRAGTPCPELTAAIGEENLWLPGAAAAAGTIGGLLACAHTGADGGEQNGTLRERILGLQVAGADGKLTRSGGRVVKNVAGYDLHRLHPGTGGAFGVLTEVTLRLEPIPERRAGVRLQCEEPAALADAWQWLRSEGPDVAVLGAWPGGRDSSNMTAQIHGDREVVEEVGEVLARGWRRWGEITPLPEPEAPVREASWADPNRELAFSLRTAPSGVFPLVFTSSVWLAELGLERRLVAYPNLGEIKLAVAGEPGQMELLWERIAASARSGDLSYRIENQPPTVSTELPAFSGQPALLRLLARLKGAFDPEGTLRPGAYSPAALERAAGFFETGGDA